MFMYIHTYIHTCIHTYIHTQTNKSIYIHKYIHTYIHTYMHGGARPPSPLCLSHAPDLLIPPPSPTLRTFGLNFSHFFSSSLLTLRRRTLLCGGRTVLITGGAGYIGTHTAVALQEAGYDVMVRILKNNNLLYIALKYEMFQSTD